MKAFYLVGRKDARKAVKTAALKAVRTDDVSVVMMDFLMVGSMAVHSAVHLGVLRVVVTASQKAEKTVYSLVGCLDATKAAWRVGCSVGYWAVTMAVKKGTRKACWKAECWAASMAAWKGAQMAARLVAQRAVWLAAKRVVMKVKHLAAQSVDQLAVNWVERWENRRAAH